VNLVSIYQYCIYAKILYTQKQDDPPFGNRKPSVPFPSAATLRFAVRADNYCMRFCFLLLICSAMLFAESVAGLKWSPPAGWKSSGTTSMRVATYPVAPVQGDRAGAECVVYFFGPGQGGTIQANIDRWRGQFKESGGKPAAARVSKLTINALAVTNIDVLGEYSGVAGPAAAEPVLVSAHRLLGAIVEGPGGNVFIKFTGPAKTMAANQAKFRQLLDSFEKITK
jgi:hypothetical protein